jgi:tryptophan synthase alpha chain
MTMFEAYLRERLQQHEILLMTHIVIGYPSLEASLRIIENMVAAGVDLMELQIPFSEPIADGPVILNANQLALAGGVTVHQCLDFGRTVASRFDIPFFFMSYYNILFRHGLERFAAGMRDDGISGAIVPDLPLEEGEAYIEVMKAHGRYPIFIFSPHTTDERMGRLAEAGGGFVYCVARTGVTGHQTRFADDLTAYLERCRRATDLPLAVGFGVKSREDVTFLTGKVDIAVIGSETIRLVDQHGPEAVGDFIRSLR